MAYRNLTISDSDWARAEAQAHDMKELGFDAFGLDDETLLLEAASSFKYGTNSCGARYTLEEAKALICTAFEKLYGLTPACYWERLENKPPDVLQKLERRENAKRQATIGTLPVIIWDIPG